MVAHACAAGRDAECLRGLGEAEPVDSDELDDRTLAGRKRLERAVELTCQALTVDAVREELGRVFIEQGPAADAGVRLVTIRTGSLPRGP